VRSYKQGGWSVRGGQRSAVTTHSGTNPAWHNLKHAVEVIQTYCSETGCRRLALGGSADTLGQLYDMLPKGLREEVIGEFAADMEEPPAEILRRSLEVAMRADLKAEKSLVTQVLTAAAKGGAGVTGLTDTLSMVHQGRVRTLLVDEDFGAPGNVCGHCGYVSAEPLDRCPFCSYQEFAASTDVVNLAIHKALQAGADVNVVRDNEELLRAGGIAALLRY
jgi:peptide subunit release factor 1 (eRF1)